MLAGLRPHATSLIRNCCALGLPSFHHPQTHRAASPPGLDRDVGHYPLAKISDIHQRIGAEIPRSRIRRSFEQLN
jgi:ATP-dependent DNA helicase RecG